MIVLNKEENMKYINVKCKLLVIKKYLQRKVSIYCTAKYTVLQNINVFFIEKFA